MKNRRIIFTTVLSALVCFALLPKAQAAPTPETPDPISVAGTLNTADGHNALHSALAVSAGNSAFGGFSLFDLTTGDFNTGCGLLALALNTADSNTAVGAAALLLNTTGTDNTAVGTDALLSNVSASTNAAVGTFAAQNNDSSGNGTAFFNTAVGGFALQANVDGTRNTAVGAGAIESGDGGNDNTAVGELAGNGLTGNSNTCLGSGTGLGITSSSGCTILGAGAGPNPAFVGNDCIYIGTNVTSGALESNTIRIGDNLPTGAGASACFIGGILSNPIPQAPGNPIVTIDTTTQQLGVTTDFAAAKVMEQQKKIEEQQASITELKNEVHIVVAQLKEQAAQIQRVSARLEVRKTAPQVVANKP